MDLAIELAGKTADFPPQSPAGVVTALADLVRAMNCYYSNLIEGHDTHPVDIERVGAQEGLQRRSAQRNLQLEARSHITVQRWIDEGTASPGAPPPQMSIHEHSSAFLRTAAGRVSGWKTPRAMSASVRYRR